MALPYLVMSECCMHFLVKSYAITRMLQNLFCRFAISFISLLLSHTLSLSLSEFKLGPFCLALQESIKEILLTYFLSFNLCKMDICSYFASTSQTSSHGYSCVGEGSGTDSSDNESSISNPSPLYSKKRCSKENKPLLF